MATQIIRRGKRRFYPARPAFLKLPTAKARCIWRAGDHNAFTDLVAFGGALFCVFREANAHVSPDGVLRILKSHNNGKHWRAVAVLQSDHADLRDGKLIVMPDGRLQLLGAGALHRPLTLPDGQTAYHQSYLWLSDDGEHWSDAIATGEPGIWLWRLCWQQQEAYAVGYSCLRNRFVRLYRSTDGIAFSPWVSQLNDAGYPNESGLMFLPDGTALCLLRRDPHRGLLGEAQPPYFDWQWRELNCRIGGPVCAQLPDGRLLAVVRLYDHKVRTSLCWLDRKNATLTECLQLPSGGDTSYAGLVIQNGLIHLSYYSSHQGKTAVYYSVVRLSRLTGPRSG